VIKKKRKMSEQQRVAAAERLAIAREKRLRENPPKYANIHPSVVALPDDHALCRKNIVQWIKTQKSILSTEKGNARRNIKGAEAKAWSASGYIRQMEYYLKHGDWCSDFYGEYEEKKTKWKVLHPAG
tara:strand:+ start:108 stop:488 length:381 start_codon:yes stop_codon:yes gene_type:complete